MSIEHDFIQLPRKLPTLIWFYLSSGKFNWPSPNFICHGRLSILNTDLLKILIVFTWYVLCRDYFVYASSQWQTRLHCKDHFVYASSQWQMRLHCKDHFVYAFSQWQGRLQCSIISHWLGTYTKWSLTLHVGRIRFVVDGQCLSGTFLRNHQTLQNSLISITWYIPS